MHYTALALFLGLVLWPLAPQDPAKPPGGVLEAGKMDAALLKKLDWLCGTWVMENGGKVTEEHWRPLQGTTILGSSHSYDAEKSTFFEYLRIGLRNGTISYVAMPGGAPPTAFRLAKLEDGLMVFENEKHDHPQRISYQKTADGVTATISLLDGTRAKSFVFKRKA